MSKVIRGASGGATQTLYSSCSISLNCSSVNLPGWTPLTSRPKSTNLEGSAVGGRGRGTVSMAIVVIFGRRRYGACAHKLIYPRTAWGGSHKTPLTQCRFIATHGPPASIDPIIPLDNPTCARPCDCHVPSNIHPNATYALSSEVPLNSSFLRPTLFSLNPTTLYDVLGCTKVQAAHTFKARAYGRAEAGDQGSF